MGRLYHFAQIKSRTIVQIYRQFWVLAPGDSKEDAANSTSLCLSKEKLQEKRHSGGEDFDFSCPGRKQVCSPLWLQTCPRHVCLTRRALLRTTLIKTTQRGAAAPLWILPGERKRTVTPNLHFLLRQRRERKRSPPRKQEQKGIPLEDNLHPGWAAARTEYR